MPWQLFQAFMCTRYVSVELLTSQYTLRLPTEPPNADRANIVDLICMLAGVILLLYHLVLNVVPLETGTVVYGETGERKAFSEYVSLFLQSLPQKSSFSELPLSRMVLSVCAHLHMLKSC